MLPPAALLLIGVLGGWVPSSYSHLNCHQYQTSPCRTASEPAVHLWHCSMDLPLQLLRMEKMVRCFTRVLVRRGQRILVHPCFS